MTTKTAVTRSRLAYPIAEAFELIGVSRTKGMEEIRAGQLCSFKNGKRRMVSHRACEDYVQRKERESATAPVPATAG